MIKTLQTETATTPLKVEKGPEVTLIAKEEKQKLSNGVIVPVRHLMAHLLVQKFG